MSAFLIGAGAFALGVALAITLTILELIPERIAIVGLLTIILGGLAGLGIINILAGLGVLQ